MSLNTLIDGQRMKTALPIVFAFFGLASIAWQISLDLNLVNNRPTSVTDGAAQQPPSLTPVNSTGALSGLFGNSKKQPSSVPASLPQTRLKLSIRGLFANADGSGQALIAANNKPAKLYQVGAQLPGNAVLESISAEHVVLRRAGRFEQLRLLPLPASRATNQSTAAAQQAKPRKARTTTQQSADRSQSLTERLKRLRAQN